jgi:hypothetical protein
VLTITAEHEACRSASLAARCCTLGQTSGDAAIDRSGVRLLAGCSRSLCSPRDRPSPISRREARKGEPSCGRPILGSFGVSAS